MAVFAVDITSLQEHCRPVTRTIHTAERDDPVHYCFHLTYLSLQDMSVSCSTKPQSCGILQNSLSVCKFLKFRTFYKISSDTDHIAVAGIERQLTKIHLEGALDDIQYILRIAMNSHIDREDIAGS